MDFNGFLHFHCQETYHLDKTVRGANDNADVSGRSLAVDMHASHPLAEVNFLVAVARDLTVVELPKLHSVILRGSDHIIFHDLNRSNCVFVDFQCLNF